MVSGHRLLLCVVASTLIFRGGSAEAQYSASFARTEALGSHFEGANQFSAVKTTDRIEASLPVGPVELAQPFQMHLQLRGPGVKAVHVTQYDGNGVLTNRHRLTPIGNDLATVVAESESGEIIEITPLQIGDLHLEITVEFSDGAEEIENYTIKVEPTSTGLQKFTLHQGLSVLTMDYGRGSEMQERFLEPEARYEGLDFPIHLPRNLSAIQITVDQPEHNPVISIDANGKIHALREGKATITGEFAGMRDGVLAMVELATALPAQGQPGEEQRTAVDGQKLPFIGVANLSDSQGANFGPYFAAWKQVTEESWGKLFPVAAGPRMRRGVTTIRFRILRNGRIMNDSMRLEGSSGDVGFDRAVWGTLMNSRYPPLPIQFHGAYLELRTAFSYDQRPER